MRFDSFPDVSISRATCKEQTTATSHITYKYNLYVHCVHFALFFTSKNDQHLQGSGKGSLLQSYHKTDVVTWVFCCNFFFYCLPKTNITTQKMPTYDWHSWVKYL